MAKYYMAANRYYVLSPACVAEISMRMTISQVLDWPRAEVLGQSEVDLFHYMLWKRVTSYVQDFKMRVPWENLPSSSDGSVLVLSLPRPEAAVKKQAGGSGMLPSADERPNSPVKQKVKQSKKDAKKANYIIQGGFTTWTVIPFTDQSANQYGQLVALAGPTLDSARRRLWFVLVDAVLYIYPTNSSKVSEGILSRTAGRPPGVLCHMSVSCVFHVPTPCFPSPSPAGEAPVPDVVLQLQLCRGSGRAVQTAHPVGDLLLVRRR